MPGAYLPILLLLMILGGLACFILYLSRVIGPKEMTDAKAQPFESGIPAAVSHHGLLSVRYYLIAMIFILFDIEVVFLYPWAVLFRRLGLFGFVEIVIFLGILAVGLAYAWRKGGLEWE
ncbi:MAG: NADH-quinone oxidoreductase subunit A [Deltaproteobacteria bacterium]|nr:NADH-quinone oxidoreductase subunit A [Deltaproteobacteria bacterium]